MCINGGAMYITYSLSIHNFGFKISLSLVLLYKYCLCFASNDIFPSQLKYTLSHDMNRSNSKLFSFLVIDIKN